MALQHLRSATGNKRPTPASMADGQLAVNTAATSPGLFFKDAGGALVKVGPVHVGTTAPNATPASGGQAGNSIGEQWLDTASGRFVFKIWDGTAWRTEDGEFVNASGDVMTGALGIIAGSATAPGLYFSGDTNTGIYSPGADQVAISTNGVGRLFVNSIGDVFLNNSSSRSTVSIGDESFEINSISNSAELVIYSAGASDGAFGHITFGGIRSSVGASARISANRRGEIVFGNNDAANGVNTVTERMRITADGRLGLGTSAPGAELEISKNVNGTGPAIRIQNTSTTNFTRGTRLNFNVHNGTAQVDAAYISGLKKDNSVGGATSGGYLTFSTANPSWDAPEERMRIDSSGRVGIGTTSPAYTLDVNGDARISGTPNTSAITVSQAYGTTETYSSIRFLDTNNSRNGGEIRSIRTAGAYIGSNLAFYTLNNSAALQQVMYLSRSKTVGIGTEGGSSTLEINAAAATSPFIAKINTAEAARIDSSGRLLVGTSTSISTASHDSRMQVAGNSFSTSTFSIQSYTNSNTGAYLHLSKSRGATVGTQTLVQSGDTLGSIRFLGSDGNSLLYRAAQIEAISEGTPASSPVSMPARLVFSTTADGASSPTERLRITSAGVLQVADAGNISVGTTTGTKIGTATTQKLGFYNATPVVQPAAVADATTAVDVITQLNDLLAKLRTLGIIAT